MSANEQAKVQSLEEMAANVAGVHEIVSLARAYANQRLREAAGKVEQIEACAPSGPVRLTLARAHRAVLTVIEGEQ